MNQKTKLPTCANCGYNFKDADNYCPECGQKNHEIKIPVKHFIEEFIEHTFHLDSKIFKSIKLLVFYPGKLSVEFNEGKRIKYFTPLKLYILISIIFFFLLNLQTPKPLNTNEKESNFERANINFSFNGISTNEIANLSEAQFDSLLQNRKIERTTYNNFMFNQLYKISNSSRVEFIHSLIKNISYMMFLLMPGFALLIYLFYKKKIQYYSESFIISVHFHSFIFLLFSVMILIGIQNTILFPVITIIMIPVYHVLMLKNIFNQKIITAILKTLCIGILYLFLLAILISFTVVISLIMV